LLHFARIVPGSDEDVRPDRGRHPHHLGRVLNARGAPIPVSTRREMPPPGWTRGGGYNSGLANTRGETFGYLAAEHLVRSRPIPA